MKNALSNEIKRFCFDKSAENRFVNFSDKKCNRLKAYEGLFLKDTKYLAFYLGHTELVRVTVLFADIF